MKSPHALLTLSTLALALGLAPTAQADDSLALSFELEPVAPDGVDATAEVAAEIAPPPAPAPVVSADAPLPLPPGAENPPLSGDTTWPAGVYGGVDALALGSAPSVQALLPPPPPLAADSAIIAAAIAPAPEPAPAIAPEPEEPIDVALGFDLTVTIAAIPAEATAAAPPEAPTAALPMTATTASWDAMSALFEGGTDSLVARAVGSAEGTRTPEGHKNPAYFGHVDPGNGVWNLGTFSYQHGAQTPEEADLKQLQRLQTQTEVLRQKAEAHGLDLSPEELLNGIDLANQAPLAALDRGGYIDWLKEAHALGMTGSEAIVWARTRSFIDPDTQRWNAPGLGNNVYSIHHDQERRAQAIARAIDATGLITPLAPAPLPAPATVAAAPPPVAAPPLEDIELDFALLQDLPQPETTVATAPPSPADPLAAATAPNDDSTPTPLAAPAQTEQTEAAAPAPEPAVVAFAADELAIAPAPTPQPFPEPRVLPPLTPPLGDKQDDQPLEFQEAIPAAESQEATPTVESQEDTPPTEFQEATSALESQEVASVEAAIAPTAPPPPESETELTRVLQSLDSFQHSLRRELLAPTNR
ncbi:MAG TPA: hypothetical protein V6D02_07145 [Candidatus Obscuribacterales bacterium]